MAFVKKLQAAKADEQEAVETYGKNIKQAKSPHLKTMLHGIRQQEKGHRDTLSGAIKGLQAAKPKDK